MPPPPPQIPSAKLTPERLAKLVPKGEKAPTYVSEDIDESGVAAYYAVGDAVEASILEYTEDNKIALTQVGGRVGEGEGQGGGGGACVVVLLPPSKPCPQTVAKSQAVLRGPRVDEGAKLPLHTPLCGGRSCAVAPCSPACHRNAAFARCAPLLPPSCAHVRVPLPAMPNHQPSLTRSTASLILCTHAVGGLGGGAGRGRVGGRGGDRPVCGCGWGCVGRQPADSV